MTHPYELLLGKNTDLLPLLGENVFDSCVCDPPYGLKFMGKKWDYQVPSVEEWRVILASMKPGAYLLAFGGSRTFHRMAVNIEDAGFEIRDTIMWLYGSGFPKSLNVAKSLVKALGVEPTVLSQGPPVKRMIPGADQDKTGSWIKDNGRIYTPTKTKPTSELAQRYEGFGTALKPAHEPIILARKPLIGTVVENVQEFGVGGINIDGCRIDLNGDYKSDPNGRPSLTGLGDNYDPESANKLSTIGRWPANVIHDGSEEVVSRFPYTKSGNPGTRRKNHETNAMSGRLNLTGQQETGYGDEGNASRFFYCAKANNRDRNEGVDMTTEVEVGHNRFDTCETCGGTIFQNPTRPSACQCEEPVRKSNTVRGNTHPTVKPTELMRYLCRLVTPPGGLILDPYMGSGSTGKAAILERFGFVGIDDEDIEIARQRCEFTVAQLVQS